MLYGFGLIFYEIWSGSILPYYGAMFVVAAFLFTLATPWLVAIGVSAALAGAGIHWWVIERATDGHADDVAHQPADQLTAWAAVQRVRQRHAPAVPVAGVPVRRDDPRPACCACDSSTADPKRSPSGGCRRRSALGLTLFGVATLLSDALGGADATPLAAELASRHPFDRGLLYTASALGTALIAFTLIYTVANRFARSPIVQLLAHAGQMSLTLYVLHALVFNFIVNWQGWIRPAGLDLALTFAAGLLDRGDHRRLAVAPPLRHRPGGVAVPQARRREPRSRPIGSIRDRTRGH